MERRLSNAVKRAQKEAEKLKGAEAPRPPRPAAAGSGRPPLAKKGLSETEKLWDHILQDFHP